MKIKKVLAVSLLSSLLVLSSCDGFFNNRRKNDQNYGSNVQEDDYTGKKGATELNKEEWDKAFGLEETIMHRSLKVNCVQDQGAVVTSDIDHGRVKTTMTFSSGDEHSTQTAYLDIKSVNGDLISGEAYDEYSGEWKVSSFNNQSIVIYAAQMGILKYEYNDFTYDKASKSYKADHFTNIPYEDVTLEIYDCVIKVNNGLPASVDFTFSNGDSDRYTYSAEYSDYGNVSVTLPDVGGGSSTHELPTADGEKITVDQFIAAFNKRKEADFNHVSIKIDQTSEESTLDNTIECDYLYGVWQANYAPTSMDDVANSLILKEESLATLSDETIQAEFYYDAKKNEYSMVYGIDILDSYIYVISTYDEYFYAVKQVISFGGENQSLEATWSKVDQSSLIMNVSGRLFKGLTIQEKDFEHFNEYVEVFQNATIIFNDGMCKLVMNKNYSETDGIIDVKMEAFGSYYQDGNVVTASFQKTFVNGEEVPTVDAEDNVLIFTIDKDTVIVESPISSGAGNSDVHVVFKYEEPFNQQVDYPGQEEEDEENYDGDYRFAYLDYEMVNSGEYEEAEAEIEKLTEDEEFIETLYKSTISINSSEDLFALGQADGARVGSFKVNGNVITATLTSFIDYETGERSEITPQNVTCKVDDDGYIYLQYKQTDTYIIYIVYHR